MEQRGHLGARIRDRRHEVGLTQAEVAHRAAVSPSYLSDVERGRRVPALDVLDRIARAVDCLVTDLLQGIYPYGQTERPPAPDKKGGSATRSGRQAPSSP